jgi:hypothetical protein
MFGWGSKRGNADKGQPVEQAVIVYFHNNRKDWADFFDLEAEISNAINAKGVGAYDGNELATNYTDGRMYLYGPDADKLFAAVSPYLRTTKVLKDIEVKLRYGSATDENARTSVIPIVPFEPQH